MTDTKEERKALALKAVDKFDKVLADMSGTQIEALESFVDWLRDNKACGYKNLLVPFVHGGRLNEQA